jgi:hypothetical protein
MLFPHISFKEIDKVNRAIDNPNRKMVAMQSTGIIDPKAMDVFNLGKHGHRKFNHSIPSAFMAAFMVSPEHAAELAMAHLVADKMGNYIHDAVGSDNKDIIEGMINKNYTLFRETNGMKTPRKKKMFY